jgi:hypothetical protein
MRWIIARFLHYVSLIEMVTCCSAQEVDGITDYPSCVVPEEKRRLGRHVSTSCRSRE